MSLVLRNCLAEPSYVIVSLAGWSMREWLYAVHSSCKGVCSSPVFTWQRGYFALHQDTQ